MSVEHELTQIKIEFASFTATVKEWMNTTVEYREALCRKNDVVIKKIEHLEDKLVTLPCEKRAYIPGQLRVIWGVLIIAIGALVTAFINHLAK